MTTAERAEEEDIGTSRGGRTTKCHAVCDAQGRLRRFCLTAGQRHDMVPVWELLDETPLDVEVVIADKAYDSHELREWLEAEGLTGVIPRRNHDGQRPSENQDYYRERNLIERAFNRLKDFRRVATRYDKRSHVFEATIALAAIKTWFLI